MTLPINLIDTGQLLLAQLEVPGFESLLRDWMAAQPGVAEEIDALVCIRGLLRLLGLREATAESRSG